MTPDDFRIQELKEQRNISWLRGFSMGVVAGIVLMVLVVRYWSMHL